MVGSEPPPPQVVAGRPGCLAERTEGRGEQSSHRRWVCSDSLATTAAAQVTPGVTKIKVPERKTFFANHPSEKGFVSRIYKELLQLIIKARAAKRKGV